MTSAALDFCQFTDCVQAQISLIVLQSVSINQRESEDRGDSVELQRHSSTCVTVTCVKGDLPSSFRALEAFVICPVGF